MAEMDGTGLTAMIPSSVARANQDSVESAKVLASFANQAAGEGFNTYLRKVMCGSDITDNPMVMGVAGSNPQVHYTQYLVNMFASWKIPTGDQDPSEIFTSFTIFNRLGGAPEDLMQIFSTVPNRPQSITLEGLGDYTISKWNGDRGDAVGTLTGMGTRIFSTSKEPITLRFEPEPASLGTEGRFVGQITRYSGSTVALANQVVLGGTIGGAYVASPGNTPICNLAAHQALRPSPATGMGATKLGSADDGLAVLSGPYHADELIPMGGFGGYSESYQDVITDVEGLPAGVTGASSVQANGLLYFAMDGGITPDTTNGTPGPRVGGRPGPNISPMDPPSLKVTVQVPAMNIPTDALAAYGNSFMPFDSSGTSYRSNPAASGGAIFNAGNTIFEGGWPSIGPLAGTPPNWTSIVSLGPYPGAPVGPDGEHFPWDPAEWKTPLAGAPTPGPLPVVGQVAVTYIHSRVDDGVNVTASKTVTKAVYAPLGTGMENATTQVDAFWVGRTNLTQPAGGSPPPNDVGIFPLGGAQMVHTGVQGMVEMADVEVDIQCPPGLGRINGILVAFTVFQNSVETSVGRFFYGISAVAPQTFAPQEWASGLNAGYAIGGNGEFPFPTAGGAAPTLNGAWGCSISNFLKMDMNTNNPRPGLPANGASDLTSGRWAVPGLANTVPGTFFQPPGPSPAQWWAPTPIFPAGGVAVCREDVALAAEYPQGVIDGRPGQAILFEVLQRLPSSEYGWPLPNADIPCDEGNETRNALGGYIKYANYGPADGVAVLAIRELRGNVGMFGDVAVLNTNGGPQKYNQKTIALPVHRWGAFQFAPLRPICAPIPAQDAQGNFVTAPGSNVLVVNTVQPYFVDMTKTATYKALRFYTRLPVGAVDGVTIVDVDDMASGTTFTIEGKATFEVRPAGKVSVAQLNQRSNLPLLTVEVIRAIRLVLQKAGVRMFYTGYEYNKMIKDVESQGATALMAMVLRAFSESAQNGSAPTGHAAFNFAGALRGLKNVLGSSLPVVQSIGSAILNDPEARQFAANQFMRGGMALANQVAPSEGQAGRAGLFSGLGEIAGGVLGGALDHVVGGASRKSHRSERGRAAAGERYGSAAAGESYGSACGSCGGHAAAASGPVTAYGNIRGSRDIARRNV